jgi:hypothetical protein
MSSLLMVPPPCHRFLYRVRKLVRTSARESYAGHIVFAGRAILAGQVWSRRQRAITRATKVGVERGGAPIITS